MDASLPDWLNDLMDEYPTNRSDNAIIRLARVFADTPAAVMQTAVDTYMKDGNKFFPKVGDLSPYVKAVEEWQGRALVLSTEQSYERGMVPVHRKLDGVDKDALDAQIALWEVARGTMPPAVLEAIQNSQPVHEAVEEVEWVELFA